MFFPPRARLCQRAHAVRPRLDLSLCPSTTATTAALAGAAGDRLVTRPTPRTSRRRPLATRSTAALAHDSCRAREARARERRGRGGPSSSARASWCTARLATRYRLLPGNDPPVQRPTRGPTCPFAEDTGERHSCTRNVGLSSSARVQPVHDDVNHPVGPPSCGWRNDPPVQRPTSGPT